MCSKLNIIQSISKCFQEKQNSKMMVICRMQLIQMRLDIFSLIIIMKISFSILTVLLLIQAISSVKLGNTHNDIKHDYCWKNSYGRGVGKIPSDCGQYQKLAALCYDRCPSGYKRWGLDCHQVCPSGFADQGLFCRKSEYGRGAGFPWKFRDGFNNRGMFKRCEAKHGRNNCQKTGLIVYPKCKPGYNHFGCCICRPPVPNCRGLGLNGGLDLSCAKYVKIGKPHFAECPSGTDNNAGLCYKKCNEGYNGVGPVCWMKTPNGWVGCGMAAATTKNVCVKTILKEIFSVAQMAFNIAMEVVTLGGSTAAVQASNAAKNAGKIADLKKKFGEMKNAVKNSKQIQNIIDKGKKMKQKYDSYGADIKKSIDAIAAANELVKMETGKVTEADMVRISAQIAALVDPTGIASVIQAFSYPKCSDIF